MRTESLKLNEKQVAVLQRAKASILKHPDMLDMTRGIADYDSCGTVCCIAGWMATHHRGKKVPSVDHWSANDKGFGHEERGSVAFTRWHVIQREAVEALLLKDEDQSEDRKDELKLGLTSLFHTHNWDSEGMNDYCFAGSNKRRAKVTADYIDRFIKANS